MCAFWEERLAGWLIMRGRWLDGGMGTYDLVSFCKEYIFWLRGMLAGTGVVLG